MNRAEVLEVEIRKCRWIADVVNDDSARSELLKLAVEYESEATQLDREDPALRKSELPIG